MTSFYHQIFAVFIVSGLSIVDHSESRGIRATGKIGISFGVWKFSVLARLFRRLGVGIFLFPAQAVDALDQQEQAATV